MLPFPDNAPLLEQQARAWAVDRVLGGRHVQGLLDAEPVCKAASGIANFVLTGRFAVDDSDDLAQQVQHSRAGSAVPTDFVGAVEIPSLLDGADLSNNRDDQGLSGNTFTHNKSPVSGSGTETAAEPAGGVNAPAGEGRIMQPNIPALTAAATQALHDYHAAQNSAALALGLFKHLATATAKKLQGVLDAETRVLDARRVAGERR